MKINSRFLKKILFKKHLYIIPLMMSSYVEVEAQTLNVSGSNWVVSVPTITEAGTNYSGTYQSSDTLLTLSGLLPGSFLNLLSGGAAKISMHYIPTAWNNSLRLYAKRSGGTTSIGGVCVLCTATINGGTTYIEIPQGVDATFLTINFAGVLGLGNSVSFSGINTQLQISGVSVTIPATSYNAKLVFTIGPN